MTLPRLHHIIPPSLHGWEPPHGGEVFNLPSPQLAQLDQLTPSHPQEAQQPHGGEVFNLPRRITAPRRIANAARRIAASLLAATLLAACSDALPEPAATDSTPGPAAFTLTLPYETLSSTSRLSYTGELTTQINPGEKVGIIVAAPGSETYRAEGYATVTADRGLDIQVLRDNAGAPLDLDLNYILIQFTNEGDNRKFLKLNPELNDYAFYFYYPYIDNEILADDAIAAATIGDNGAHKVNPANLSFPTASQWGIDYWDDRPSDSQIADLYVISPVNAANWTAWPFLPLLNFAETDEAGDPAVTRLNHSDLLWGSLTATPQGNPINSSTARNEFPVTLHKKMVTLDLEFIIYGGEQLYEAQQPYGGEVSNLPSTREAPMGGRFSTSRSTQAAPASRATDLPSLEITDVKLTPGSINSSPTMIRLRDFNLMTGKWSTKTYGFNQWGSSTLEKVSKYSEYGDPIIPNFIHSYYDTAPNGLTDADGNLLQVVKKVYRVILPPQSESEFRCKVEFKAVNTVSGVESTKSLTLNAVQDTPGLAALLEGHYYKLRFTPTGDDSGWHLSVADWAKGSSQTLNRPD